MKPVKKINNNFLIKKIEKRQLQNIYGGIAIVHPVEAPITPADFNYEAQRRVDFINLV